VLGITVVEAPGCFLAKPSLFEVSAEQRAVAQRGSAGCSSGKTERPASVLTADLPSIELGAPVSRVTSALNAKGRMVSSE